MKKGFKRFCAFVGILAVSVYLLYSDVYAAGERIAEDNPEIISDYELKTDEGITSAETDTNEVNDSLGTAAGQKEEMAGSSSQKDMESESDLSEPENEEMKEAADEDKSKEESKMTVRDELSGAAEISLETEGTTLSDDVLNPEVWDGSVASDYAGGTGTASDPYLISNASELAYFSKKVNDGTNYSSKYFALTDDIYLNDVSDFDSWTDTKQPANVWTGINNFAGTLDGRSHTIYGLYMNRDEQYTGFFNQTSMSKKTSVRNLRFKKSYVIGTEYVGMLIGKTSDVDVKNCISEGSVIGIESNVGGLIGACITPGDRAITISDCENKASVFGKQNVGGIAGYASMGNGLGGAGGRQTFIFSDCVNDGIVQATEMYVGGIAGKFSRSLNNDGVVLTRLVNKRDVKGLYYVGGIFGSLEADYTEDITLEESCNYGEINGTKYAGGIVGEFEADMTKCYIKNVYNTGGVKGDSYVGGISGTIGRPTQINYTYNIGIITGEKSTTAAIGNAVGNENLFQYVYVANSYYLSDSAPSDVTGIASKGEIKKIEESNLTRRETFTNFDFNTVWKMGKDHPVFQWQIGGDYEETVASGDCGEDVKWYLDHDGVLTVYGRGYMDDWEKPQDVPWYEFASDIKKIVVKDGVMSVGKNAFYWCNHVETVSLGNSVTGIGDDSFEACMNLKEITLPASVKKLGESVFFLSGIEKVTFQGAAPQISSVAFLNVTADVYYNSTLSGWEKAAKQNYGGALTWMDSNLTDNEMIDVYAVDLKRDGWFPDTILPAVPSAKISQYAEELYQWAKLYGYDTVLTKDKCNSIVNDYMPTVAYAEGDVVLTEDEYQTWEIMRDIIMLNSMKKSLQSWENTYLKNADVVDLTKTQKKASEILAVYADYTENTKRNPISEALYNIYALDLVKSVGNKTWSITKSYFTSDLEALIEKGDIDSLSQHMFVFNTIWKSDSSTAMGELLGGLGQELKENLVKKVSEEEWNKFTEAIINKNPTLGELKSLKDALSSYTGSFKKFSLLADYAPGILFEIQLLQLGQKLMDTIADTKGAQYFMIQYYLLHMQPGLYEKVVSENGEIIDYMTWTEQVGTGKIQVDGFLQELMGNWYKTGSQSLKNSQKNSLAVLASTASTLQDMSVRTMQEKLVAYWAQKVESESSGSPISQIQYTLDADQSFSVLNKTGETVGTYQNHSYTSSAKGKQDSINTMSLVDESDYIDADIYVTEDSDHGLVTVAVHSADYGIKLLDDSALVFVEVMEKQGHSHAAIFKSGEKNTVYSVEGNEITAKKDGGEVVSPNAVYRDKDSVIDRDTENLEIQYDGKDYASCVRRDVVLPTKGNLGSSISWDSSKESVVGADGTVNRPDYDEKITLTATVSYEGQTRQKKFELLVKGKIVTVSLRSAKNVFAQKTVRVGDKLILSELNGCVPNGYKANGWFYDEELQIPYFGNQTIDGEVILYTELQADAAYWIKSFSESLDAYNEDTVTSDDREYLEGLSQEIETLLSAEDFGDDDIAAFHDLESRCESLLTIIADIEEDIQRLLANAEKYEGALSVADKSNLEQIISEIDELLSSNHLTDAERMKLSEAKEKMQGLLTSIKNVKDVTEQIERLPEKGKVSTKDAGQIQAAQQAYDKLTDREKALVDSKVKKKLDMVVKEREALKDNRKDDAQSGKTNLSDNKGSQDVRSSKNVQTGDNVDMREWIVILFAACLGLTCCLLLKKRRSE